MKNKIYATAIILLLAPLSVFAREANFRPALGDILANSPAYERAVITDEGGLILYSGTGKLLSGFPVFLMDRVFVSSPIFANLTGDGTKTILAITRDGVGAYKLVAINGQGQMVYEAAIPGSTYFDPVVLKVNSLRDHVLVATEQGKVFEAILENATLNLTEILDAQAPVAITADPAGFRFFLAFQKTNILKLYQKAGNIWNPQKTYTLKSPVIYPVLYDGSQRLYYISDAGMLMTLDITAYGMSFPGFPVSFSSLPTDAPILAEVDSGNPGKEIVLDLANGERAVVNPKGNIIPVSIRLRSLAENATDGAELNEGLYLPVHSLGGLLSQNAKKTLSTPLSRFAFDMSWWQEAIISPFVGTFSGTAWDSVNSVLKINYNPLVYFQFEETSWKNPKAVVSTLNPVNNGTAVNGAASVENGKFGRGVQFDGINDYISTPLFFSSSSGWTISAWYKTDVQNSSRMALVGGNNGGTLEIYVYQGHPGCRVYDTASRNFYATTVTTGQWHHVACVQENGSQPSTAVYVDGVLNKKIKYSSISIGGNWHVGKPGSSQAVYYKGLVDEVLIVDRAFSPEEISALYKQRYGTFVSEVQDAGQSKTWSELKPTPAAPYGKELVNGRMIESGYASGGVNMDKNSLLLHLNEASGATIFSDSSGLNHTGTCSGVNCPSAATARLGNGAQMDGIDDYLTIVDQADLRLTDNFTAMGWVKRDKLSGYDGFFGKLKYAKKGATLGMSGWNLNFDSPSNKIAATVACNGAYQVIHANTKDDLLWHHVALRVLNGKSALFVDGIEQTEFANTVICDSGENMTVGRYYSDIKDHYLQGLVDEVALFNEPFSAEQILNAYKRGSTRVLYQARSCDDAGCSGEDFSGPNQSAVDYFSESQNITGAVSTFPLNLSANRYFQYSVQLMSDRPSYSPWLTKVDFTASP